jgi:hypothetical protein
VVVFQVIVVFGIFPSVIKFCAGVLQELAIHVLSETKCDSGQHITDTFIPSDSAFTQAKFSQPEDGGSTFHQNVGLNLHYTV